MKEIANGLQRRPPQGEVMANPRTDAAPAGRLLTPLGGLVFSVTLCLVAFWVPLLTLVGERL